MWRNIFCEFICNTLGVPVVTFLPLFRLIYNMTAHIISSRDLNDEGR